jgi:cell division protein FtsL
MRFLIGTVLWALALLAVWEKVDVYRTGYAIEQMQSKKKQVQQEQRALQVELAKLTSPERIERVAVAQLGLVRPRYDQVVVVGMGPQQKPPSAQADGLVRVSHTE